MCIYNKIMYYSAIKKNEVLAHATTWVNLKTLHKSIERSVAAWAGGVGEMEDDC